ncbi:hypothetical protein J2X36_002126 [Methylobacterium sp. BE186]|uniref:hypothetical protein n=1 Tax=Methylobacterium sp. BE186 TaxID=2817715 RepID=UPI002867290F|nr:hypothetical protein [Methylobacterium sp. BE186]MDR7037379.1 hypothetical protein [Methylobacterium sp. BE186]
MGTLTQTASAPGSSPVPATRPLLDLVSKFQNRLEDGDRPGHKLISAGIAPSDAERDALEARRRHLIDCLTPSPETLLPTVTALLSAFPTYGISPESAKQHASLVCRALDDCPTWAVNAAASRFIKGKQQVRWEADKAPTAPQIRAEAKLGTLDIETELHRLSQILDAEIVDRDTTADERAANVAAVAKLIAEMRNGEPENERLLREAKTERLAKAIADLNDREAERNAA